MAVYRARRPYFNTLKPANLYSRPAIGPLVLGTKGVGYNQYNLMNQYRYTLQQMAASPFAVNNQAYMERIRKEYGYSGTSAYETMGTIGGVVGAGAGALYGAGALRPALKVHGLNDVDVQSPFTGKFAPRRASTKEKFYLNYNSKVSAIKKYQRVQNQYETLQGFLKQAQTKYKNIKKALNTELEAATKEWDRYKYYGKNRTAEQLKLKQAARVRLDDVQEQLSNASKQVTKYTDEINDLRKSLETAHNGMRAAGVSTDTIKVGTRISTKAAGLTPGVGLAIDSAGLALSIAGLHQSIEQNDVLNIALNSVAVVADSADVAGDVVTLGGGPAAPIGAGLSTIAGVVSLGISAIQGFLVGRTLGRSLSPEGARSQQLFAENLYGGMVNRPISTISTGLALTVLPVAFGRLSGVTGTNTLSKAARMTGQFMTHNALGNQVRAGVSMLALQGIGKYTGRIEDALGIGDKDFNNLNTVSAISLYGDINDNLYGATRNKAILLGVVSGDSKAMTDAMARSWGYSDDMYRSVMFDDIRQATGKDLGYLGNTVVSTLGELLMDPQNMFEVKQKMFEDDLVNSAAYQIDKRLDLEEARAKAGGGIAPEGSLAKLVDDTGVLSSYRIRDREGTIQNLVRAYVNDGEVGVRNTLRDLTVSVVKGNNVKLKSRDAAHVSNAEILNNFFKRVFNGEDVIKNGKQFDVAKLKEDYKRYQWFKKWKKEPVKDADIELVKRVERTYKHLQNIYGVDNDIKIFDKFVNDLDIKLDTKHLSKLYATYTDMAAHIELNNVLAGRIMMTSNPATRLVQQGMNKFQLWSAMKRITSTDMEHRVRTITDLDELRSNESPSPTKYDDYIDSTSKTIEDYTSRDHTTRELTYKEEVIKNEYDRRMQDLTKRHAERRKQYKEQVDALKETMESLKQEHEALIHVPKSYTGRRGDKYYLSADELSNRYDDLRKLQETLMIQADSPEEVMKIIDRKYYGAKKDTRQVMQKYRDLYNAIMDYRYVTETFSSMREILGHVRTAILTMDTVSLKLHNKTTEFLKAAHIFRKLINSDAKPVKRSIGLKKFIKDAELALEDTKKSIAEHRKEYKKYSKLVMDETSKEEVVYDEANKEYIKTKKLQDAQQKLEAVARELTRLERDESLLTVQLKRKRHELSQVTKENDYEVSEKTFDIDNLILLEDDKTIGAFEQILAYYGMTVSVQRRDNGKLVFDANGNPVYDEINPISLMRAENSLLLNTPTTVRVQYPLRYVIQRSLFDLMHNVDDIDVLLNGLVKTPEGFEDAWSATYKDVDGTIKRVELLYDLIDSLGLPKKVVKELRNVDTLNNMYEAIDIAVRNGGYTVERQLEDVDENFIQAMVVQRYLTGDLKNKDPQVRLIMKAAAKEFELANKKIMNIKKTDDYKDNPLWQEVLDSQLRILNHNLRGNQTYQYFKSLMTPPSNQKRNYGIFLDPSELYEIVPKRIRAHTVEKLKNDKYSVYTKKEIIKETIHSPEFKEGLYNTVEESLDNIVEIHNAQIKGDPVEVDLLEWAVEELKKAQAPKQSYSRHRKRAEKNIKKSLEAITPVGVDDIRTSNVRTTSGLEQKALTELPYINKILAGKRLSNKRRGYIQALIVRKLLRGELKNLKFKTLTYILEPTTYKDEKNNKYNYFEVMRSRKKSSGAYRRYVERIAYQLVYLLRTSGSHITYKDGKLDIKFGDIKLDPELLNNLNVKAEHYVDPNRYLARLIMESYMKDQQLTLEVVPRYTWKLTNIFKSSLDKAVVSYVLDNVDTLRNKQGADVYTALYDAVKNKHDIKEPLNAVKRLLSTRSKQYDYKELTAINKTIFQNTVKLYNSEIEDLKMEPLQRKLRKILEQLYDYERKDIVGTDEHHLKVYEDVVKRLSLSDSRFIDVLKDVETLSELDDNTPIKREDYKTQTGYTIALLNHKLRVDYANKKSINTHNVVKFEFKYDPNGLHNAYFYIKPRKGSKLKVYTLLDLVMKYGVNRKSLESMLHKAASKMRTGEGLPEGKSVNEDMNNILGLYDATLYRYKDILSRSTFDLDDEAYRDARTKELGQGHEMEIEEEIKLLNDYDIMLMYRMLKNKNVLDTGGSKGPTNYKRLSIYADDKLYSIYRKVRNRVGTGKKAAREFVIALLDSDVPDAQKQIILRKMFFTDFNVTAGIYTQEYIKKLRNRVKTASGEGKKLHEIELKNALTVYNNRLWKEISINKDVSKEDARTPAQRFKPLYNALMKLHNDGDDDMIRLLFDSKTRGASGDFVMAKTDEGKYIMVADKYRQSSNVKRDKLVGIKDNPHINEYIGEYILKTANDETKLKKLKIEAKYVSSKIPQGDVVHTNKYGTVMVCDTPESRTANMKLLKAYMAKMKSLKGSYKFYIITKDQYEDIVKMKDEGIYNRPYRAIKTNDGKSYTGLVLNTTNIKGSRVLGDVFLEDLDRIGMTAKNKNQSVNDTVKDLQKFGELVQTGYARQSYFKQVSFNKTDKFQELRKNAKTHLALRAFLDAVDPTGDYTKFNLDWLIDTFFNNDIIDNLDTLNIRNHISDEDYKLLTNTIINKRTLLSRIEDGLKILHDQHRDATLAPKEVLKQSFIDTVKSINNKAMAYVMHLIKIQNDISKYILPELIETRGKNVRLEATGADIAERAEYLKELRRGLYIDGDLTKGIKYNEKEVRGWTTKNNLYKLDFDKQLKPMLVSIRNRLFTDTGQPTDTYNGFVKDLRIMSKEQKKERTRINKFLTRYQGKEGKLDYTRFWDTYRKLRKMPNGSTKVPSIDFLKLEEQPAIREAAKRTYKLFKERLFVKGWEDHPVLKPLIMDEFGYKDYIIDSEDAMYRHMILAALHRLTDNIARDTLRLETEAERIQNKNKVFNIIISMKSKGASNKEIDQAIIEFKKSIPKRSKSDDTFKESYFMYGSGNQQRSIVNTITRIASIGMDVKDPQTESKLMQIGEEIHNVLETLSENVYFKKKTLKDFTIEDLERRRIVGEKVKNDLENYKTARQYVNETMNEEARTFAHLELSILGLEISEGYEIGTLVNKIGIDNLSGILPGDFYKNVYAIVNRKYVKNKFESHKDMYKHVHLPILENSPDFKKYVYDYLFGSTEHQSWRNKLKEVLELPHNADTMLKHKDTKNISMYMYKLINEYYSKKKGSKGYEQLYVFTQFLTFIKEQYLRTEYKGKWNWGIAHRDYVQAPLDNAIEISRKLATTDVLDKDNKFGHNPVTNIRNDVVGLFDSLNYVGETNKKLSGVLLDPNRPREIEHYNAKPQWVVLAQSNITTQRIKTQVKMYNALFVPSEGISLAVTKHQLLKAQGDIVHDMIVEQSASSYQNVQSRNVTYYKIRKLFTELSESLRLKSKADEFIKIVDVGSSLLAFEKHSDAVGYFYALFDTYMLPHKGTERELEINKAISAIREHFLLEGHLKNLNDKLIKATIARIIYQRFDRERTPEEITKSFYNYSVKQLDHKQRYAEHMYKKISYNMNGTRSADDLSQVLYGKPVEELEQYDKDFLHSMINLERVVNSGLTLMADRLYDTYDYMAEGKAAMDRETTTISKVQTTALKKVKRLNQQIKDIENELANIEEASDITEANKILFDGITALDKKDARIEVLKEEYDQLNAQRRAENEKVLDELFNNNPTLIAEYYATRTEDPMQLLERAADDKEIALLKEHPMVVKEFKRRRKIIKDKMEFMHSAERLLYANCKTLLDIGSTYKEIYEYYTEDLNKFNTNNATDVKIWMSKIKDKINKYNSSVKFDKDPFYKDGKRTKDAKGKPVYFITANKRLKKAFDKAERTEAEANNIIALRNSDVADLSYAQKYAIVREDLARIVKLYDESIEANKKSIYTKGRSVTLDEKQYEVSIKRIKDDMRALEKRRAHVQQILKDAGIKSGMTVFENSYKEYIKNYAGDNGYHLHRIKIAYEKLLQYKKQYDQLNRIKAKLKRALHGGKVQSYNALLKRTATHLFGDKYTTEAVHSLVKYLAGGEDEDLQYSKLHTDTHNKYKELENTKKSRSATVEVIRKMRKFIRLSEKHEEYIEERMNAQDIADVYTKKVRESVKKTKNKYPNRNTNLGTFRTLYEDELEKYADGEPITDKTIMDFVIDKSVPNYNGGKVALENLIIKAGVKTDVLTGREIHNPVVDVLITRLNYLAQQGKNTKTFVVMDMETVKTARGEDVPYQMALLIQRVEDGKTSFDILNNYFNNAIFYQHAEGNVKDITGEELKDFYAIQYKMMKRDYPTMSDEAIKDYTDKLANKIRHTRNVPKFIDMFINILNSSDTTPIIAHNGSRFDFGNYENFIKQQGNKLLTNAYYQKVNMIDTDELQKRFKTADIELLIEQGFGADVIKLYRTEIKRIVKKLDAGLEVTPAEAKNIVKFEDKIYTLQSLDVFKDVEDELLMTADKEIRNRLLKGEDSEAGKIKQALLDYVEAPPYKRKRIRNKLLNYFRRGYKIKNENKSTDDDIAVFTDKYLAKVVERYEALITSREAIDYSVFTAGRRQLMIDNEVEPADKYDVGARLRGLDVQVDELKHTIDVLERLHFDTNKTVEALNNEYQSLKEQKEVLEKTINEATKKLEAYDADYDNIYSNVTKVSKQIYESVKNLGYRSSLRVDNIERALREQSNKISASNERGLIRSEIAGMIKTLAEDLNNLTRLATIIESYKKDSNVDVNEFIRVTNIDPRMLSIKNEKDKTNLLVEYQKESAYYKKLLNDVDNKVIEGDIKNIYKSYQTKSAEVVKELYKVILPVVKSKQSEALIGKINWTESDTDIKQLTKYEEVYKKLEDALENNPALIDDTHFNKLKNLLSPTRSEISKHIRVIDAHLANLPHMSEVVAILRAGVAKDLAARNDYIKLLKDMDATLLKDGTWVGKEVLTQQFKKLREDYKYINDLIEAQEQEDVMRSVLNKGTPEWLMGSKEFDLEAAAIKGPEYVEKLKNEDISRVYNDVLENNDVYAWVLDPKKVYHTEVGDSTVTFAKQDIYNDTAQTVRVTKYGVYVDFTFNHRQAGLESVEQKPIQYKRRFGADDAHRMLTKIEKNFYKEILGYTRVQTITDHSKDTIIDLIKHVKKHIRLKQGVDYNTLTYSTKGSISDRGVDGLHLKDLKLINVSELINDRFREELDFVNANKANGSYSDMTKLYRGIASQLMGKYRSLVPGKILNRIPSEFSIGYIAGYDEEGLVQHMNEHNVIIDLMRSSEGSAGTTFSIRSKYTADMPFTQHTNGVRSILSNEKIYAKYTALKIINDLYKLTDDKKITKHIDAKNEALKELKQTYDGQHYIEAFTPNVLTEDMFDKYNEDVLHKVGLNASVAFVNHPKAFEDVILVDEDWAIQVGWDFANKTWLGAYGFKGAVEPVKGLKAKYGAAFVANADSVVKRGAYGVIHEMAINNVRRFLLEDYDHIDSHVLKQLHTIDKDKLKTLFTLREGKAIVNSDVDYEKLLTDTLGENWRSLLVEANIDTREKYTNYADIEKEVHIKGGYIGEVYVMLDSDHVAKHMMSATKFIRDGKVTSLQKDPRGGYGKGINLSPSVMYPMLAHGIDVMAAFKPNNETLTLFRGIEDEGLNYVINKYKTKADGSERTPHELVEYVKDKRIGNFDRLLQTYYTYYLIMHDETIDGAERIYAKQKMDEINIKARNQANESITGRHGVQYKQGFYRVPGVSEQLVANMNLGLGQIKMSADGLRSMLQIKENFLHDSKGNAVPKDEIEKIIKMSNSKIRQYIEDQGYYGHVLARRSPVQDYNAVPVLKVVGVSKSAATEANIYLYNMIGGDNDGDVLGMAGLNNEQYDILAPRKGDKRGGLDATNPDYYDEGYLDNVDADAMKGTALKIQGTDPRFAYVGKKTFDGIRGDRNAYTWTELYKVAFDVDVTKLGLKAEPIKELSLDYAKNVDDTLLNTYMNAIVRMRNNSSNYDAFLDSKDAYQYNKKSQIKYNKKEKVAINKMYENIYRKEQELIQTMYAFDQLVGEKFTYGSFIEPDDARLYGHRLSKVDQEALKTISNEELIKSNDVKIAALRERLMYRKFYAKVQAMTLQRIQSSKRGINEMGGMRKEAFVASHLSTFTRMNKDATGKNWDAMRSNVHVTVNDVSKYFTGSDLTELAERFKYKLNEQGIRDLCKLPQDAHDDVKASYQEFVDFIIEQYKGLVYAYNETTAYHNARSKKYTDTTENNKLISSWRTSGKDTNPIVSALINKLERGVELNTIDKQWIDTVIFGRFASTSRNYRPDAAADGYGKQIIIDRGLFNSMSRLANDIIAVSKHYGIDVNSVEFLKEYGERLRYLKDKLSIRKVATLPMDFQYSMAIAMDKNEFEFLRYSDEDVRKKRDELPGYETRYDSDNRPEQNYLEDVILTQNKVTLFNDTKTPDSLYKRVHKQIQVLFDELTKYELNELDQSTKLKNAIKELRTFDVPAYALERAIKNNITLFRRMYHDNRDLSRPALSLLKNNNTFFELVVSLHTPEERVRFAEESSIPEYFKNYMLGTREVDPSFLYSTGVDTGTDDIPQASDGIVASKTNYYRYLDNMEEHRGDIDTYRAHGKADNTLMRSTEDVIKKYNLHSADGLTTIKDLLNDRLKNTRLVQDLIHNKKQKLKVMNKYSKDDAEAQILYALKRDLINYKDIEEYIRNNDKYKNEYRRLKLEVQEKEAELVELKAQLTGLNASISRIKEHIRFHGDLSNKEDIINSLKADLAPTDEQRQATKSYVMSHIMRTERNITPLLHTPDNLTIHDVYNPKYKEITQKTIDDLYNSNIMNMDKYQTPFRNILEITDEQFSKTGEIDWKELWRWYKTNKRFHRLTVVVPAHADEGLARRIYDALGKTDTDWEQKTAEERNQSKNIEEHYNKIKFKTEDDLKDFCEKIMNIDERLYNLINKPQNVDDLLVHHNNKELVALVKEYLANLKQSMGLDDFIKGLRSQDFYKDLKNLKIRLNGQEYDGLNVKSIDTGAYLSPTVKEIIVKGPDDLRTVWEYIKHNGDYMIGFTDLDSFMSSMEQAYKPYQFTGAFRKVIGKMQSNEKLLMRLTPGFLLRNYVDTWNQLFSETYVQQGFKGFFNSNKNVLRYTLLARQVYGMYKRMNEERLMTLLDSEILFTHMEKLLVDTKANDMNNEYVDIFHSNYKLLRDRIKAYVDQSDELSAKDRTNRIQARAKRAKKLLASMDSGIAAIENNVIKPKRFTLLHNYSGQLEHAKDATAFLMNIHFAEFFTMYDKLRLGKSASSPSTMFGKLQEQYNHRHSNYIDQFMNKYRDKEVIKGIDFDDFKHILFEISAFMNTNAQVDVYKQESYKYIYESVAVEQQKQLSDVEDLDYDSISVLVNQQKKDAVGRILKMLNEPLTLETIPNMTKAGFDKLYELYDKANTDIENSGRIAGYLFDRYLYGYTHNEAVNKSLKRFFNYGQRSGLELQLLANIPYMSFPIRSIDNWLERLMNPSYIRVMSDIIDGIYGQYANEDGQYDEYTKYLMNSGWLPLWKGFGIRLGHGALDVQEILSSGSSIITQRQRPMLRAVQTLLKEQDYEKALSQLATMGALSNVANSIVPRETAQNIPVLRQNISQREWGLNNATTFTFSYENYNKYTPYKYRNQNNNARYKRYENIYKNWFNKYGRMRQPTTSALDMVDEIQWKQYVKYRQTRNAIYYR